MQSRLRRERVDIQALATEFPRQLVSALQRSRQRVERTQVRLELLDPKLVLKRGYAWLANLQGQPITSVKASHPGQALRATLADGEVDLTVSVPRLI